ncbi:hypothetical protein [Sodalinema gerasimenkoae]|uniref:hypothetical protein n=1 Tax=Sodalinema gerasimenkoae TaxID=2862348 RepID=UPI00186579AF|nr:hypothetical protein [Sodalinema gerasimenkoae]
MPDKDLQPWQPTPPPSNLVFDDGEPLESHRHRLAMNLLIDSVEVTLSHRQHPRLKHGGFVPPLQVADQLSP